MTYSFEKIKKLTLALKDGEKKRSSLLSSKNYVYKTHVWQLLKFKITSKEFIKLIEIDQLSTKALEYARKNDFTNSRVLFETSKNLILNSGFSRFSLFTAFSSLNSQYSYYYFKLKEYEMCIAYIRQAFLHDLDILYMENFDIILIHKIQLINNLLRVYRDCGFFKESLLLCLRALAYLENPRSLLLNQIESPWNKGWPQVFASNVQPYITRMHRQISIDLLTVFRDYNNVKIDTMDVQEFRELCFKLPKNTQIAKWMRFRIAETKNNPRLFLDSIVSLLTHGANPTGPLYKDSLMSLYHLIN